MSLSIYNSLDAGLLKKISIIIQLADRSIIYPQSVLKDVLVQVDGLVFSADFYIIGMKEDKVNITF